MASQVVAERDTSNPSSMAHNMQNEDIHFQSCEPFLPKFYFFYGLLMDPGQLTRVLTWDSALSLI